MDTTTKHQLEKQLETVTAKLDAYCKASVMKVDYDKLKKQLEAVRLEHRKEYDRAEMETGRAKDAEAQLDAVRDAPVTIKINADGQAWIKFNAGGGREALVNLNNLVSEMPRVGINRGICMDALSAALQGDKDV